MVRGKTWFRCTCCGHVFEALDIENNATVRSMPMTCPRCGGKGLAIHDYSLLDRLTDWFLDRFGKKRGL